MDKKYLEISRIRWNLLKVLQFNNILIPLGMVIFTFLSDIIGIFLLLLLLLVNNVMMMQIYWSMLYGKK